MKTITEIKEEVFQKWLKIVDDIQPEALGATADSLRQEKNLAINLYRLRKLFLRTDAIYFRARYATDLKFARTFDFFHKNIGLIGNFVNEIALQEENCIEAVMRYKGETFAEFTMPFEDIKHFPGMVTGYAQLFYDILSSYTADEAYAVEKIKEDKENGYAWFNISRNSMRIKLRIWKDNYPQAYQALIDNLEMPTYEELTEMGDEN